jgi:hypothetical protein
MPRTKLIAAFAVGILVQTAGIAVAADASVAVKVSVAPPPIVLAPPTLVLVPGTSVHHVPSASFNLFVYGGRYYSFHNGAWFVATGPSARWTATPIASLPAPIRAVPAKHYKIPPGHARKQEAQAGGWCPPGQASKGRC